MVYVVGAGRGRPRAGGHHPHQVRQHRPGRRMLLESSRMTIKIDESELTGDVLPVAKGPGDQGRAQNFAYEYSKFYCMNFLIKNQSMN
jgi:hypothetical protein